MIDCSAPPDHRYLFHHMRCGILVVIRDKKLVVFAPFANKDYTNDWDGA